VIIVDAGVFVAALFPNDRHHEVCRAFLSDPGDDLGVSPLVVAEICHLFKRSPRQPQPEIAFLRLLAGGRVASLAPTTDDYDRMADLVGQYASLPLGAADASVVAIAERLGVARIATVDRRDFTVVRPHHVPAFELIPDLKS
jgi:predicted nucleic acid-binding protein